MAMESVTLWIAFLGGLASFFSPCILPLIPGYLSYLSGSSLQSIKNQTFTWDIFFHTLFFCAGFTLVFTLLGTVLGGVGNALPRTIVSKVGGVFIIAFGLYTLGLLKIPFLGHDYKIETKRLPSAKYLTSFIIGFAFGIGWTPCVSAILAAILVLAAQGSATAGSALLFAFSVGLMIPFLLTGLFTGFAAKRISSLQPMFKYVSFIAGLMLIVLGIMVYTQRLITLSQWFL